MENIILTCLQAQLIIQRVNNHVMMPSGLKNDLIWEIKQMSPQECKYDKRTNRSTQPDA